MTTRATWSVARLLQNDAFKKLLFPNVAASSSSSSSSSRYSPKEILSQFNQPSPLTVKRSLKEKQQRNRTSSRFFMYEEHASTKLKDDRGVAQTITVSPNELATLLMQHQTTPQQQQQQQQTSDNKQSTTKTNDYHYYWTSPISSLPTPKSPPSSKSTTTTVTNKLQKQLTTLRHPTELPLLDPRGPSLWMGTSRSGTQCHYDVANNIIVQLYGTKRVRCYSPSVGVEHLHVFPDAHPRARKSQVDFDDDDFYTAADGDGDGDGASTTDMEEEEDDDTTTGDGATAARAMMTSSSCRFPHFANVPPPNLDVILQPGDILEIPAFWFHHVENGYPANDTANNNNNNNEDEDDGDTTTMRTTTTAAAAATSSVSINSFSLSRPMMMAQQIFQKGSLRHDTTLGALCGGGGDGGGIVNVASPSILKVLGTTLIRGLKVVDIGMEEEYIRRYLLDARYVPLLGGNSIPNRHTNDNTNSSNTNSNNHTERKILTEEQLQAAKSCVDRILPDFQVLLDGEEVEDDRAGIALLVGLHLMELWAVELVGAASVADAWDKALS